MSFSEYLDRWIHNLTPEKQAKWKEPYDNSVTFCTREWVLSCIEKEYATGKICPIMDIA